MRSVHHSLFRTAAAILAIAGVRLDGQRSPGPSEPVVMPPGIESSEGELSNDVLQHVSRGDALIARLRYAAAEQEFRQAISIAHRQGNLASLTSWRLACAYFYEGRPEQAARTLDELAREAAGFGDLGIEAHALFNAAWLFGEARQGSAASMRIATLKKLLRSRYMPVDVRDQLVARLATPATLTAR